MDETRAVSVFFCWARIFGTVFYVHDLWSLFHLSFYALLTAITIKENGGLKNLISGLDNWVAEIISFRNRVLIVKNTIESIDTPETNFTENKIDMSRGDSNIVTVDEIEDDLLPPAEYVPIGIFLVAKLLIQAPFKTNQLFTTLLIVLTNIRIDQRPLLKLG
ncbi:hypothetical protein CEXT_194181 [Caerostris extrusa]|uniref:Uncharacterized protein n=1 Tax=Caerostris extrusa TaxID=172846 RepID=A0AAV4MKV5_CAEEX|nr:hypothetical protein CEXT_194181 [Caerostris extrusa]